MSTFSIIVIVAISNIIAFVAGGLVFRQGVRHTFYAKQGLPTPSVRAERSIIKEKSAEARDVSRQHVAEQEQAAAAIENMYEHL